MTKVKSKSTVNESMALKVRTVKEKPEREITIATEEAEEEAVPPVPRVVKIVPRLLAIQKRVRVNVVVDVAVTTEVEVVVTRVNLLVKPLPQAEKKEPRDQEEIAEAEVDAEVTNNPETKERVKTLMERIESKTKKNLNSK